MTDLTKELNRSQGIPFLEYKQFVTRTFFPKVRKSYSPLPQALWFQMAHRWYIFLDNWVLVFLLLSTYFTFPIAHDIRSDLWIRRLVKYSTVQLPAWSTLTIDCGPISRWVFSTDTDKPNSVGFAFRPQAWTFKETEQWQARRQGNVPPDFSKHTQLSHPHCFASIYTLAQQQPCWFGAH